jgi:signal transduction histidine kinase
MSAPDPGQDDRFRPPVTGTRQRRGFPRSVSEPATSVRRDPANGLVAGVCSGFAARLGIDPILLRIGFVATLAAGGVGVPLYAIAWVLIPAEGPERPVVQRLLSRRDAWLVAAGVGCLVLAALLLMREWGLWFSDRIAWPAVIVVAGAAVIWRQSQAPPDREAQAPARTLRDAPARSLRLPRPAAGRAGVGAALVVGGAVIFLWLNDALAPARDVVLPVAVVALAAAIILAPWWLRLVRGLADERAARIRSQERAEVAAHLHDSVLQTLALVQRRADDPREVAALARRQERELRAWLNDSGAARTDTLAAALEAAAAEVEADHGVPIEVVTVGDAPLGDRAAALVAAAREALVNASKFAGPEPIALYAEFREGRAEVFVRDRGPGFDPAVAPADRRGVRDSIVARMERHGGRAVVHSTPGHGTEVELVIEA